MSSIFDPAISELERQGVSYSEPQSFQKYLDRHNIKSQNTAACISIQKLENLKPELRRNGYMVFRLGCRANDSTTHFGLAKLRDTNDWSEYFLIDKSLFERVEPEIFIPNVSVRQLFAFNLLANLTENSLINLAISSGLLASALNIETSESLAAPASGQGIFTFEFKPSPYSLLEWKHINGQVEIDALFVGRKDKKETLFVIEAKTSDNFESLSKHKLVYPILALSSKVPGYIPMIPVYIRAIKPKGKKEIHFYIAVCNSLDERDSILSISDLSVVDAKHFILMGFN